MDGAPRVARSPPPSPCRRLQSSLVLLVVVCHLLVLAHDLWTAVSGCDTEEVFVNTTTTEPSQYTEHCWDETCFTKCCADQQGIASSETTNCSDSDTEFDSVKFVSKVMAQYHLMDGPQTHNSSIDFFLFYNKCESNEYNLKTTRYEFTYNNSQQTQFSILVGGTFLIYRGLTDCADFVVGTDLMVLIGCHMHGDTKSLLDSVLDVLLVSCMTLSTVAILLVIAVYLYLSQLQGAHGNALLCYLIFVMALHPTLIWLNFSTTNDNPVCYKLLAFLGLGSVSWLTVMSYDIWSTFSRPLRPRPNNSSADSDNHKFLVYSLVGWGYPITHLLLMLYVKCVTKSIIYKSILFTMALNLVMFLSTVVNMRMLQAIKTADVHDSHRHNHTQQGVLLYVKLSLLMGVDWFIFLSSWMSGHYLISIISYVLLESQGTLLFVLLVCNGRVLRLLRDKWRRQPTDSIRVQ